MKLKNSYILLIALIGLLVGMGFVCASENVSNDDMILASGQTDNILADGENTTQEKINTTIDLNDSYSFNQNDELRYTIPIDVKDNESNSIEFSESDLSIVDSDNDTVSFMINERNITITHDFIIGNHTLLFTYNGNETYASALKNVTFLITHDKELTMPSEVVSETGSSVVIPVTVSDGIENYTVAATDLKVQISYINAEGEIQTVDVNDFSVTGNNVTVNLGLSDFIEANVTVNYTETLSSKSAVIKLLTTVNTAGEVKINTLDDKNFTVTVKDGNGKDVTVSKDNLKIYEGTTEINFNYENNVVNIASELSIGKHNLTISYLGNNTYNASNGTIIVGVFGNSTFSTENSTNIDNDKNINLQLNLTDGVDPVTVNKDNLNITVNYIDESGEAQSINITDFTVEGQIATFQFDKNFTKANLTVSYITDEGQEFNSIVTVKVNTVINAEDVIQKGDYEVINFTANVTSADGADITVDNNNFKVYNGETQLNTTYADGVFTINDKLTYGIYNLTIRFTGDDVYSDAVKNFTLTILGFNTGNVTNVTVNSTKHVEVLLNLTDGVTVYNVDINDLNITVYYLNSTNGTVTINLTNIAINNNTLSFDLVDGNFTSAKMLITYKNTTQANLTLNRVYNINVEVINNVAEYQSGNFTYKLSDIDAPDIPFANKTVALNYKIMSGTITFQQHIDAQTDENGVVVFNNSQIYIAYFNMLLGIGNNSVSISGDNLNVNNSEQNITITQATIKITIDKYSEYYGSEKKVAIHAVNSKTGDPMKYVTLHLYMPSSSQKDYYFQTNENGTSEISVTGLVGGTYAITVNNNDTENMTSAKASGSIVIKKIPVKINAKSSTMYYNSGTTSTIKITKNGKAVSGVYVLVRLYTSSSNFQDFLFQSNKKGQISFSAPLSVGKHKMIVVLADNRYEASQVTKTITVKKATAKINAPKVTTYYKSGKYFTVKLVNSKNKKVIYGAKLNVKIFVSKTRYYNFNGQTGSDGKIRLTINLKPGTYNVQVSGKDSKNFKASKVSSKIVVKKSSGKITAKKLTAKKGANKYFQVKVINKKNKKAVVGLKLKVKVNSKTYTLSTNSKGIAKLSTKSFKVGTYKVTIRANDKYCPTNTVKSTIKIKK